MTESQKTQIQWRNYRGSSYSRAVGPGRVRGARPDQD